MRITLANGPGWIAIALAITSAPLLPSVSANVPTAGRDCYGFPVSDTAEIGLELQQRLDTVSETALMDLIILFWTVPDRTPDSCRIVPCPWFNDTIPGHYYKTWSRALFTDHELYDPLDTLHPLVPGQIEVMPGYNMLLARKSTVLAISKECYVEGMNKAIILASSGKSNPKRSAARPIGRRYDALGRSLDIRNRPWLPGFGPPGLIIRSGDFGLD